MECPYCGEELKLMNITIYNWNCSWNRSHTNKILNIEILKHFHCPSCDKNVIEESMVTEEN